MSGKKVKAARRAAGLSPEVVRGHRDFLRTMRDAERLREESARPLRERRTKRRVLLALAALAALVTALIWAAP